MSAPGDGLTELMTGPYPDARPRPGRLDAVTLLTCYVVLLMMIPSALVVGSFGSAGDRRPFCRCSCSAGT